MKALRSSAVYRRRFCLCACWIVFQFGVRWAERQTDAYASSCIHFLLQPCSCDGSPAPTFWNSRGLAAVDRVDDARRHFRYLSPVPGPGISAVEPQCTGRKPAPTLGYTPRILGVFRECLGRSAAADERPIAEPSLTSPMATWNSGVRALWKIVWLLFLVPSAELSTFGRSQCRARAAAKRLFSRGCGPDIGCAHLDQTRSGRRNPAQ